MTTIHVAHSPDSDDAFMFYALAVGKIDTEGLTYVHELQDIESLNQRAMRGSSRSLPCPSMPTPISAIATRCCPTAPRWAIATGRASSRAMPASRADVKGKRIAIPGPLTSAYLALQLYEPDFVPVFTAFDAIEDAVVNGEVDMGLLIHEGQLTFAERGLHLVADMGNGGSRRRASLSPLAATSCGRTSAPSLRERFHVIFATASRMDCKAAVSARSTTRCSMLVASDRSKADTFVGCT
jgi:1,4-dihydroxy-6-naphthoate synthase